MSELFIAVSIVIKADWRTALVIDRLDYESNEILLRHVLVIQRHNGGQGYLRSFFH